jgi:molecular chaperone DnaJ
MAKDYYITLGVERTATKAEVKKAFRRLAKQYHPDIDDSEDAEERFKELSEAYEVLADDTKRADYDASGSTKEMFEHGFDWNDFTRYEDIRDIFGGYSSPSEMYWGHRHYNAPRKGKDIKKKVAITLEEAMRGTSRLVEVPLINECTTCHGSGAFPGTGIEMCPVCRGLGQVKQIGTRGYSRHVTIQSCIRCYGKGKITGTPCTDCHGRGRISTVRNLNVKIPPGVTEGTTLRVPDEGEEGVLGGRRGDLYVQVDMAPDPRFEREGSDLVSQVYISFVQATLGGTIVVEGIDEKVSIQVPPGTQTHTLLKVKGKGMPRLDRGGRGDLLVRAVVRVPESLTERQRELLLEMAKEGGELAETNDTGDERKGLFKRLFKR